MRSALVALNCSGETQLQTSAPPCAGWGLSQVLVLRMPGAAQHSGTELGHEHQAGFRSCSGHGIPLKESFIKTWDCRDPGSKRPLVQATGLQLTAAPCVPHLL